MPIGTVHEPVHIEAEGVTLHGDLRVPDEPAGLVIFAHGSGSSRLSPRNVRVAGALGSSGYATLLLDLLTEREELVDQSTRGYRFNIPLLGRRLVEAADWTETAAAVRGLPVAFFGASTGAAAAVIAAADRPAIARAVISRGGRPDLAADALPRVAAPTLLIVGSRDEQVIALNREACRRLRAPVELSIVTGAGHLFEEPGKLDEVAQLAAAWCDRYLAVRP